MASNDQILFSAIIVLCVVSMQAKILQAESVEKECYSSCESKECLYQSDILLKHINTNVNPCEDFYTFACGGYLEKFGKDDTRSTYDDIWNTLQIRIKDLIDHLEPEKGTVSEKLKTVFKICMDEEHSEIYTVPEARDFLSYLGFPNWPIQDSEFQFDELSDTLGRLTVYGEFSFITFQPSPYEVQNKNHPAPLFLPDTYLLDSKLNSKDVKTIVHRILDYFNFDRDEYENVWESFKSIEDEGMRLQNERTGDNSKCKGGSSTMYTIINCSTEVSPNEAFLCNFWKSATKSGSMSRYYSRDVLHISCRWNHYTYIENIITYIVNINQRSLANYLILRFFSSHLDDLNFYFQQTKNNLPKLKDPERKTTETMRRMEYCIGWIIKSMPLALGYEYVQRYVNEQVQENVLDIIKDYVQHLLNILKKQTWLSDEVKFYLKRQLKKLDIGFRNSMRDFSNRTKVMEYYKEFQPVRGSFLKNILEYVKTSVVTKKEHRSFNSFYSSSDSYNMDFGLSLLLPPTYSYGLPKMLNYATLGWIIGHELGHNLKFFFDLVQLDSETEINLNNRIECYVNQYNQFIMQKIGKKTSTGETKEELLADSIGSFLTENIIKNFNDFDRNISLPGLEYTPQQIMYISLAQDSCAALSRKTKREFYSSKPQNLQNLRVLSILQNSEAFSQAFNCSYNQIMNPSNKCTFFE